MGASRRRWMPYQQPFSTAGKQFAKNMSSCRIKLFTLLFYQIKQNPAHPPSANPFACSPTRRIGAIRWIKAVGGANGTPWW